MLGCAEQQDSRDSCEVLLTHALRTDFLLTPAAAQQPHSAVFELCVCACRAVTSELTYATSEETRSAHNQDCWMTSFQLLSLGNLNLSATFDSIMV